MWQIKDGSKYVITRNGKHAYQVVATEESFSDMLWTLCADQVGEHKANNDWYAVNETGREITRQEAKKIKDEMTHAIMQELHPKM